MQILCDGFASMDGAHFVEIVHNPCQLHTIKHLRRVDGSRLHLCASDSEFVLISSISSDKVESLLATAVNLWFHN